MHEFNQQRAPGEDRAQPVEVRQREAVVLLAQQRRERTARPTRERDQPTRVLLEVMQTDLRRQAVAGVGEAEHAVEIRVAAMIAAQHHEARGQRVARQALELQGRADHGFQPEFLGDAHELDRARDSHEVRQRRARLPVGCDRLEQCSGTRAATQEGEPALRVEVREIIRHQSHIRVMNHCV